LVIDLSNLFKQTVCQFKKLFLEAQNVTVFAAIAALFYKAASFGAQAAKVCQVDFTLTHSLNLGAFRHQIGEVFQ
jgi:purine-nucleoside phosphorylase